MTRRHSTAFVAPVLLATAAAAVVGLFGTMTGPGFGFGTLSFGAIASTPIGATASPLSVLQSAKPWLTTVPGGQQALSGKVVVVNFWTYSCINSLRALPYLRSWHETYASKGLAVVGVHAPEFQFEHDAAKVQAASRQLGVPYPNLQDNNYSVWRSFANEGWPGFYFIDAEGHMRGYRFGEGKYVEAEQFIRNLLTEAGQDLSEVPLAAINAVGIEAEADWRNLKSPESYIGYARTEGFASPGGIARDTSHSYSSSPGLLLNHWDLAGQWTVGSEFATPDGVNGAIRFRSYARDMHLVLGGAGDGKPLRYRVTIDGAAPGDNHGVDIDAEGWGELKEDRLYQLIRQSGEVAERTVTIEFSQAGARVYVFTFG